MRLHAARTDPCGRHGERRTRVALTLTARGPLARLWPALGNDMAVHDDPTSEDEMSMSSSMYWRAIARRALQALLFIPLAYGCAGQIARADSPKAAPCDDALPDIFTR